MIGDIIGLRLDPYLHAVYRKLFGNRGNPNLLTLLGFFATLAASALILMDLWIATGIAIILSGLFDIFDGAVARQLGKVTTFGGFLDSVLDRYSDLLFLFALLLYYLRQEESGRVILVSVASIGTALVPYTRARAEAAGVSCNVGLLERAERIVLIAAGALFHQMELVIWVLAIFSHITVLQRITHVRKVLYTQAPGKE